MKFYKRFPGDITIKTGDLSLIEFGAYDRLLDHYYSKEEPIEVARVYSVARCQNAADRKAVDTVLRKFWTLADGGWVQQRADEMIAEAAPRIEAAKANGKKGGRPPGSKNKPNGFSKKTQDVTQNAFLQKGSQNQIPDNTPSPDGDAPLVVVPESFPTEADGPAPPTPAHVVTPLGAPPMFTAAAPAPPAEAPPQAPKGTEEIPGRPDGVTEGVWSEWCAHRKKKRARITPLVVEMAVEQAQKAGMTTDEFFKAWVFHGTVGFRADWIAPRGARPDRNTRHNNLPDSGFADGADDDGNLI